LRAALDIFWYDGGIKPAVPEELMAENKELAEEGMMFVGDKGRIHRAQPLVFGEEGRQALGEERHLGAHVELRWTMTLTFEFHAFRT
jgi:hypothetical protein